MTKYVYPARECPSFQACSAPLCPLDPDMEKRVALPGEDECRAKRATREAIAARYPLSATNSHKTATIQPQAPTHDHPQVSKSP